MLWVTAAWLGDICLSSGSSASGEPSDAMQAIGQRVRMSDDGSARYLIDVIDHPIEKIRVFRCCVCTAAPQAGRGETRASSGEV
ncbi:hypothetical protein [Methylobacterium sp. JK268]